MTRHSRLKCSSLPQKGFILILAGLAALLDQSIKQWLLQIFQLGESRPIVENVVNVTLVTNPGVAFSLFHELPHGVILLVTLSLTFLILGYLYKLSTITLPETIGFGFILGGALGNGLDRFMYGEVIDYIDMVCIHYPVFNLADAFIFAGGVVLGLFYIGEWGSRDAFPREHDAGTDNPGKNNN